MKITRKQLRRLLNEAINEATSLTLNDLMRKVQTDISQDLANDAFAPEWESGDLKDYVFRIDLGTEGYPYTIHTLAGNKIVDLPNDVDEDQKEFVESKFKAEKEKEEYAAALAAEAEKYSSKPLAITVQPPQYASGEIDFDDETI